ncbi:ricin [Elaeis guineensis]|uniref:Ribosome-inactivating protein n=1 Tax=Elaeis guineensis var. tenera TaxID=51953 RepID=A0A6I9R825_ELAGV|nr:ricin [Elaeis guineensis]XP_019705859.1 ricin [Elaeis guineensis]XP_029120668.1 ricin [Elaeis guineensis]
MKGNMKVWKAVATWVWWAAIVGPAWVCTSTVEDKYTLRYNTVRFTTVNATRESYTQFMKDLRDQLASGDERYGIPVLRDPSTVPDSQRFLLVELSNWGEASVTLAVDVINAYVVAYQAGDQSYFFRDAPDVAFSNLFTNTERQTLSFNSSYPALQRVAGEDRENIDLGILALEEAISSLHRTSSVQQNTQARSLIVSIQMVSEAARFRYIEQRVRQSITSGGYQTFRPDASMLSLENNWGALSTAIQESNQGVFCSPVQLQRPNYTPVMVDSVTPIIISNLAFMVFVCANQASSQFSPLIRSVVAEDDGDTCAHPEPTTRISGRNGLCVDVRDGQYNDGNPIQLWPCKSNTDANQLWTLKRDGTIRSNGKCLTTYGYSPGSYVMIYDCTTAVTDATRWEVWDNGTIINPRSALVLSAESGNSGTTLTVETNIYASRQGWLASNNTQPFVASIVGFMDLCLETDGTGVWVGNCASNKVEQKWALYADGSIRPQQNQDRCLTSNDLLQGTNITVVSCSPGSSGQRWVFTNDGTILNLKQGLVMDVKGSDPSLKQIILWPFTGNPNQKWLPML